MKTVRRPPYPKWNPGYFPCSSLTPPSAFLTPSIGVLRWIRAKAKMRVADDRYNKPCRQNDHVHRFAILVGNHVPACVTQEVQNQRMERNYQQTKEERSPHPQEPPR